MSSRQTQSGAARTSNSRELPPYWDYNGSYRLPYVREEVGKKNRSAAKYYRIHGRRLFQDLFGMFEETNPPSADSRPRTASARPTMNPSKPGIDTSRPKTASLTPRASNLPIILIPEEEEETGRETPNLPIILVPEDYDDDDACDDVDRATPYSSRLGTPQSEPRPTPPSTQPATPRPKTPQTAGTIIYPPVYLRDHTHVTIASSNECNEKSDVRFMRNKVFLLLGVGILIMFTVVAGYGVYALVTDYKKHA